MIHYKSEDQNIVHGRNYGANLARGDILIFLNADVLVGDIKSFFKYSEYNFINMDYLAMTCRVKVFPEEETFADRFFHFTYNQYFHLLNLLGLGMGRGECQVVRKDIYKMVGYYDETLAAGEDFDLFRRIRRLGKILFSADICI